MTNRNDEVRPKSGKVPADMAPVLKTLLSKHWRQVIRLYRAPDLNTQNARAWRAMIDSATRGTEAERRQAILNYALTGMAGTMREVWIACDGIEESRQPREQIEGIMRHEVGMSKPIRGRLR